MNPELLEKIQNKYSQLKVESQEGLILECSLEQLREALCWLKQNAGFLFLVDLTAIDRGDNEHKRFEVIYFLLNLEDYQRLKVSIFLDDDQKNALPDMTDLWPNAEWPSRELWDMFGITYRTQERKRLLNPEVYSGHPLLKDFEASDWKETLSQVEAQREQVFKESVWAKGESIQWERVEPSPRGAVLMGFRYYEKEKLIHEAQAEVGFSHKGIEKLCESTPFSSMTRLTSKLNSLCSETVNTAWVQSLETLCGLTISEKAQAMRMVAIELDRIKCHLSTLRHAAREVCLSELASLIENQLESFFQLSLNLTHKRLNSEFVRFGGVASDYPHGWVASCLNSLKQAQKCTEEIHRQLVRSHQWMERTKSAYVTPYEALGWGLSGPSLRACGVNFDLRKTNPFYFYGDVDFQIPLGINGDSYDRFLVRIEEIFQSISIVNQILDHMPAGDFYDAEQVDSLKTPAGELNIPVGQIYTGIESPNGELGVGLVADGSLRPQRVRLRTPSYYCAQSIEAILPRLHWDQAWMMLHSFNLEHSEVDK